MKLSLRKLQQHKWQTTASLLAVATIMISFQNCAGPMAACDGPDCEGSISSGSTRTPANSTAGTTSTSNSGPAWTVSTSSGGVVTPGSTSTGGTYTGTSTGGSYVSSTSTSTSGSYVGATGTSGGGVVYPSTSTSTSTASGTFSFRVEPRSTVIDEGDYHQLTAFATNGTQEATYQWYKNGAAIPNAITATWELRNVTTADSGDYYAIAKLGTATLQSATATLKVRAMRNACQTGWYGRGPETPAGTWEHVSVISTYYANKYELKTALEDAYSVSTGCQYSSKYPRGVWGLTCTGSMHWQCRNAKLVNFDDTCACTAPATVSGG